MFLFKKIINYLTPLDEEAEVERAVAESPLRRESLERQAKDHNHSESDASIKPVSMTTVTTVTTIESNGTLDSDEISVNPPTKPYSMKAASNSKPSETRVKRKLSTSDPTISRNPRLKKENHLGIQNRNHDAFFHGDGSTSNQIEPINTAKPNMATTSSNAPTVITATLPEVTTATSPKVITATSPKVILVTSPTLTPATSPTLIPATSSTAISTPKAPRRHHKKLNYERIPSRPSRSRSVKLGNYQCLICGEDFDNLVDRDSHAVDKHPHDNSWRH